MYAERLAEAGHHVTGVDFSETSVAYASNQARIKNLDRKFQEHHTWAVESRGFWRDTPYLALSNGFHYPNEKVILQQHIIIDQTEKIRNYRFWTHYFEDGDIFHTLESSGFTDIERFGEILSHADIWNGDNITIYKYVKGN